MDKSDALLALIVVLATAIGSFGGSWFGFKLNSDAAERQFRYARRVEAVSHLTGLLYDLAHDFRVRASRDEFTARDKEKRSDLVSAKLRQLSSYRLLYSPWLNQDVYQKLAELGMAFTQHHVNLSNAITWNTTNDPGDPRCVEALSELERWLRDDLPPALEEIEAEFRSLIGANGEASSKPPGALAVLGR